MKRGNIPIFEDFEFFYLIFFPLYNWNWNPIFFKILVVWNVVGSKCENIKFILKKSFVPNIIFFWNIFWCFFLTHLLPKPAQQTNNTEIEKTPHKIHKHALAREDLSFLLLHCRWLLQACNSVQCLQKILLGIPHSVLSFRFVLHWLPQEVREICLCLSPLLLIWAALPVFFGPGPDLLHRGLFFHRLFIFNSRLVCLCPARFYFQRQKCFWPTIKRGRCNSHTSKSRSKGAPKVSFEKNN